MELKKVLRKRFQTSSSRSSFNAISGLAITIHNPAYYTMNCDCLGLEDGKCTVRRREQETGFYMRERHGDRKGGQQKRHLYRWSKNRFMSPNCDSQKSIP